MENLLSEIPSEVKEFVEKNNTIGGESFLENSGSIGDHSSNSDEEEDEGNNVVEISPPSPKAIPMLRKSVSPKPLPCEIVQAKKSSSPLHKKSLPFTAAIHNPGKRVLCEEKELSFWGIGNDDIVWEEETYGNLKGPKPERSSSTLFKSIIEATLVFKTGPRIRQTARKSVSNQFEKFTFNYTDQAQAQLAQACDPRGSAFQVRDPIQGTPTQASLSNSDLTQTHDPVHEAHDPHLFNTDSIRGSNQARDSIRAFGQAPDPFVHGLTHKIYQFGLNHPFQNWVWTRNPNLRISNPYEARFRPFKRRYD